MRVVVLDLIPKAMLRIVFLVIRWNCTYTFSLWLISAMVVSVCVIGNNSTACYGNGPNRLAVVLNNHIIHPIVLNNNP